MRPFPLLFISLLAFESPGASLAKTASENGGAVPFSEVVNDLIEHPYPKYPFKARRKLLEGKGSYIINFDRDTGAPKDVVIVHSTGFDVLDKAAVDALRRWRAKPHTYDKIYVPITFSLVDGAYANALYSPYPNFPMSVRWEYPSGIGLFRLQIDRRTGSVTSVRVLKTMGDNRLDAAAIAALRQWRFKPQTLSELVVPIEF